MNCTASCGCAGSPDTDAMLGLAADTADTVGVDTTVAAAASGRGVDGRTGRGVDAMGGGRVSGGGCGRGATKGTRSPRLSATTRHSSCT
jgi:hypothetical protein